MDPITALLVIAGGAGAKYFGQRQATQQQERIRQAMEAYQRSKAAESTAATENLVSQQTPAKRAEELAALTADRTQSLQKTVNAAQATEAAPLAGKMSGDYTAAQERVAGTVAERTRRAIEQLAAMGAPGEQHLKSSMRFGRAAGTVDAANRASDYVGGAFMNDIGNVRPNPFLQMGGDVAMAVGAGGFGGSGAAASTPSSAGNAEWGSMDAGPGAYKRRVNNAFSLWGRG